MNLDNIKTIFWCREVFQKLGIDSPSQLDLNRINVELHNSLMVKFKKLGDPFIELFLSGSDGPKWKSYFIGSTIPAESSSHRTGNRPIRGLVENIFEGTSSYFDNGPLRIFNVIEASQFDEAVTSLITLCEECFLKNNIIISTLNGERNYNWDDQIAPLVTDDSKSKVEHISSFFKMQIIENYGKYNKEFLLMTIATAWIELKFLHDKNSLYRLLTQDPDYLNRMTGLELVQQQLGVNEHLWFDSLLD